MTAGDLQRHHDLYNKQYGNKLVGRFGMQHKQSEGKYLVTVGI